MVADGVLSTCLFLFVGDRWLVVCILCVVYLIHELI